MAEESLPATTTEQPPAQVAPPPSESTQQPVGAGQAAVATSAPAGAASPQGQEQFSITGWFAERGYPKDRFKSDREAFEHLLSEIRPVATQAQKAAQYEESIRQLQAQLAALQPQQAQQAPAKKKHFDAPEYDPSWRTMVYKDPETGKLTAIDGAPPDVVAKVMAFERYRQGFVDRMAMDPVGTLKQALIEELLPEIRKEFQDGLGHVQDLGYVRHVANTADWAFLHDQNGRVVVDPISGQRQYTPEGHAYMNAAETLARGGITDVRLQDQLARVLAFGMLAMQKQQAAGVVNGGQPNKAGNFAAAVHAASHGGSTVAPANTTESARPQNGKLSVQDMLRAEMQRAGVTDATFQTT